VLAQGVGVLRVNPQAQIHEHGATARLEVKNDGDTRAKFVELSPQKEGTATWNAFQAFNVTAEKEAKRVVNRRGTTLGAARGSHAPAQGEEEKGTARVKQSRQGCSRRGGACSWRRRRNAKVTLYITARLFCFLAIRRRYERAFALHQGG
jgi:hypothetical protein